MYVCPQNDTNTNFTNSLAIRMVFESTLHKGHFIRLVFRLQRARSMCLCIDQLKIKTKQKKQTAFCVLLPVAPCMFAAHVRTICTMPFTLALDGT